MAIHRDGEDLGLFGGPQKRGFARGIDAVDAAAVAGGGVERTVGGLGDAPDHRLVGGEDGIHLGSERQAAFAAERDAVEVAADEIAVGVHLPGGGAAGDRASGQAGDKHRGDAGGAERWRMKTIIP